MNKSFISGYISYISLLVLIKIALSMFFKKYKLKSHWDSVLGLGTKFSDFVNLPNMCHGLIPSFSQFSSTYVVSLKT